MFFRNLLCGLCIIERRSNLGSSWVLLLQYLFAGMTRKNAFGSRLHPANSRQRLLFGFVGCVGFAFAWAVAWVGPTLSHMEAFC